VSTTTATAAAITSAKLRFIGLINRLTFSHRREEQILKRGRITQDGSKSCRPFRLSRPRMTPHGNLGCCIVVEHRWSFVGDTFRDHRLHSRDLDMERIFDQITLTNRSTSRKASERSGTLSATSSHRRTPLCFVLTGEVSSQFSSRRRCGVRVQLAHARAQGQGTNSRHFVCITFFERKNPQLAPPKFAEFVV
jgi:hypothetical protein